jgi:hypothetical protein
MQVVWEGTPGTRRGRVGVISPALLLVAVHRGELAGSPARPASRRTRVVKPPLRMRSARGQGRKRPTAPITDVRIVTPHRARRNHVIATRHTLVALIAPTAAALALSAPAYAAGTRAGATRAAKRQTIAHVKRFGISLRPRASTGRARLRGGEGGRVGGASSTPTAASARAPSARRTRHAHGSTGAEHRHRLRRMTSR